MPSIAHGYPRLFNGNSTVQAVPSLKPSSTSRIFAMRLSPDGRFLAIGDEDGNVEIQACRRGVWRLACQYSTGGAVRTLVWHPTETGTVFSGSANGALHKITIVFGGDNILFDALIPDYIHLLEISPDGQKLVIAHGRSISFVQNPFSQRRQLGTLVNVEVSPATQSPALADQYIPRAIFFHNNATIIVAFLGTKGLRAYSLRQHSSWSIPLREDSVIGSAAVSPSGERIAVMNLRDGIDFYSTSRCEYQSTTKYTVSSQVPPRNFIVDIVFIDDDTVAFGHSDGLVGFATYGVQHVDTVFEMATPQNRQMIAPVQAITFGLVGNTPLVFAVASPPDPSSSHFVPPTIQIGQIHTPGLPHHRLDRTADSYVRREWPRVGMTSVMVLGAIAFTCLALFAGRQTPIHGHETVNHGTTHHRSASTATPCHPTIAHTQHLSTSAIDPLSTCVCTVTGTIDTVKESGSV